MSDLEISPEDYAKLLKNNEPHILLDVRDEWELKLASFEKCLNIPLAELAQRAEEIPATVAIVTLCHHGVRSLRACCLLRDMGFANVLSLKGGINRWAEEIDPSMPVY